MTFSRIEPEMKNDGQIKPMLKGFLSSHNSEEKVVSITIEPKTIFFEEGRDSLNLNFDFVISGLTDKKLTIRFIKMAVYDEKGGLVTFRHLNHNAVGTPGIYTIGKYEIDGKETFDLFNPFHIFSNDIPIDYLRYMFTFYNAESKKEYYYGNVIVKPIHYNQQVKLSLPLKGTLTILDGHDYYSHHRRFAMSIVRSVTNGKFETNFSRYGVDFTLLGPDGNTRKMIPTEYSSNYDFHFKNARNFYTDGAVVYAPAAGEIVAVVDHLEDLYEIPFSMDDAIKEDRIAEIAGNYIVIKHNEEEYSHLFHLLRGSSEVTSGQMVKEGQSLAKIGFSGAATLYSHLHYQLMDGENFLKDNPLPCKFTNIVVLLGTKNKKYDTLSIDTGDLIVSK